MPKPVDYAIPLISCPREWKGPGISLRYEDKVVVVEVWNLDDYSMEPATFYNQEDGAKIAHKLGQERMSTHTHA